MTKPRPRRPAPRDNYPNDNTVDIAVLYERLDSVMKKIDAGFKEIEKRDTERGVAEKGIEDRVAHIETQITSARWFIVGLGVGCGALGGAVSSVITILIRGG